MDAEISQEQVVSLTARNFAKRKKKLLQTISHVPALIDKLLSSDKHLLLTEDDAMVTDT